MRSFPLLANWRNQSCNSRGWIASRPQRHPRWPGRLSPSLRLIRNRRFAQSRHPKICMPLARRSPENPADGVVVVVGVGVVALIAEYQSPDLPVPRRKRLTQRAVRKPEIQKPGFRKAGVRNTGHHPDISRSFCRASPSPSISDGRSGSPWPRKLAHRLAVHRMLISRL